MTPAQASDIKVRGVPVTVQQSERSWPCGHGTVTEERTRTSIQLNRDLAYAVADEMKTNGSDMAKAIATVGGNKAMLKRIKRKSCGYTDEQVSTPAKQKADAEEAALSVALSRRYLLAICWREYGHFDALDDDTLQDVAALTTVPYNMLQEWTALRFGGG